MSRIARSHGQPAIVPPFHAPPEQALREQLQAAGLAPDGLQELTLGRGGPQLAQRALAGWVYWGKLYHTARSKLQVAAGAQSAGTATMPDRGHGASAGLFPQWNAGQVQAELEFYALLEAGAPEIVRETFNTRAAGRPEAASLAEQLAHGFVEQAEAPTPLFVRLAQRLQAAGIHAALSEDGLEFGFEQPDDTPDATLPLAQPVTHPWLPERTLDVIGALPELPAFSALREANERLSQLIESGAPQSLIARAHSQLEQAVQIYVQTLLKPAQFWFDERVQWSARGVIAPGGSELRYDQVGLPEELAWTLLGPLVAAEIGAEAVSARDEQAAQALDALMTRLWVIVNRAPSIAAHSFLAFRPVRVPGPAIRLASLACNLLDADFDGDQLAVFVPVTATGQHEAGERLTLAAHLRRSPELLVETRPRMDALLGIARLSLTSAGRAEIERLAGVPVAAPDGFVTRVTLVEALQDILRRDGAEAALEASERLLRRGFELARRSGMGIGPFVGANLSYPQAPDSVDAAAWEQYGEQLAERIAAFSDFADADLGSLVLAAKSGARSNRGQLVRILGTPGVVQGMQGERVLLRHGYRDGLTPHELFDLVALARPALQSLVQEWDQLSYRLRERSAARGYGVLARAMRSRQPGIVFALAAAARERDPLVDPVSRLFVGLAP
jgi:hypothetical protein